VADADPVGELPLRQALIHPVPNELPGELLRLLPTFTCSAVNRATSSTPLGCFFGSAADIGLTTEVTGERPAPLAQAGTE